MSRGDRAALSSVSKKRERTKERERKRKRERTGLYLPSERATEDCVYV